MKLRNYQKRTVAAVLAAYRKGSQGILVQSPCGSGKTEIAIELIQQLQERWVIVVPNSVLATQWERRLREAGVETARYGCGINGSGDAVRVQVATIQMLLGRDARKELRPGWICFDEAHHYEAEEWAAFSARYPRAKRLGLTATPERDDGRSLQRHFEEIIIGATYAELRDGDERLLVPSRVYAPKVSEPGGYAMDPVQAWCRYGEGRRTIASVLTTEQAQRLTARFNSDPRLAKRGIRAGYVGCDSSRAMNQEMLQEFADGKVRILCSVYYIAEGFDVPEVGCMMYMRRFQFRGTYVQFGGRALRPAAGKVDAVHLDLVGCSYRHGKVDSDADWLLAEQDKPGRQKTREPSGEGVEREIVTPRNRNVGLVRVAHGALKPTDPDPAPFIRERPVKGPALTSIIALEAEARQMAKRKGIAAANEWLRRERKRHVRLTQRAERSQDT